MAAAVLDLADLLVRASDTEELRALLGSWFDDHKYALENQLRKPRGGQL